MIVDFTIKNFRSIKTEQTFSMYARNKPKHLSGNISYIEDDLGVLKTSAIYGANASGKTNILKAFECLQEIIVESGDWKQGDSIEQYQPYLLSEDTKSEPTEFEIEFYAKKIRYRYEIHFNESSILFEKLEAFYSARASYLFERLYPDDWENVRFGESYKGGRKKTPFFPNNSYLSKVGNSADSPQVVRDIYNYFRKNINIQHKEQVLRLAYWDDKPHLKRITNSFLKEADLGIDSFDYETTELPEHIKITEEMPSRLKRILMNEFSRREVFYHTDEKNNLVKFSKDMESSGTQRLFELIPAILEILINGEVLLIDEIENSFHPHIAKMLVKIFNDPTLNINNAQLIYTTHDLSLMTSDLLRKDQIYLTEKSISDGSTYFTLEDFDSSLKDNSPFSKWYNEGKLGGIPHINFSQISLEIKKGLKNA